MIAVAVTDTMKVTANVITTSTPVDNESDPEPSDSLSPNPVHIIVHSYVHKACANQTTIHKAYRDQLRS